MARSRDEKTEAQGGWGMPRNVEPGMAGAGLWAEGQEHTAAVARLACPVHPLPRRSLCFQPGCPSSLSLSLPSSLRPQGVGIRRRLVTHGDPCCSL